MHRPVRRLPVVLVAWLAFACFATVVPRAVRAADANGAVSQMTAEELAFVKRRIPDWDRLDAVAQEKVAQNVLRVRSMSPEQRERLLERLKQIDPATLPGRLEKFGHFEPDQRADVRRLRQRARVIGMIVVQGLPPDARAAFDPASGGALLNRVEKFALENCFLRTWFKKAVEPLIAAPPATAEPSPGAPEPFAAKFREARDAVVAAGGARAPIEKLHAFAERYVQDRFFLAEHAAPPADPSVDPEAAAARARAVADRIREQFPEAAAFVVKTVADAARGGRAQLLELCRADLAPIREEALVHLFVALEQQREAVLAVGGDIAQHLEALQASILKVLRIPEWQVQELEAAKTPAERRIAVLKIAIFRKAMFRGR